MKILATALLAALGFAGAVHAAPVLLTNDAAPALNGSTVIDFEGAYTSSASAMTFNGVTLGSTSPLMLSSSYSGSFGTIGKSLQNGSGTSKPITIDFGTSGAAAFGFSWGAADEVWTLDLFDLSNSLIGSLNIAAQSVPHAGFIGADGGGLTIGSARLTLDPLRTNDWVFIDNLEYVAATATPGNQVPEPASAALLGLGLLGVAVSRKRKQS